MIHIPGRPVDLLDWNENNRIANSTRHGHDIFWAAVYLLVN